MSSAAPKATNSFLTINILIVHNFYKPLYSSFMDIKIFPKLNTCVFMMYKHRNYCQISGKLDRKPRCQQFAV